MIVAIDKALRQLEKHCPLSKPVTIKGISKREGLGFVYCGKFVFVIEIATDVDSETQVDTLIHEWAHCLAPGEHHNDIWY